MVAERSHSAAKTVSPRANRFDVHSVGIGVFLNLRETVAAQQLSQILGPDAPILFEKSRLAPMQHTSSSAKNIEVPSGSRKLRRDIGDDKRAPRHTAAQGLSLRRPEPFVNRIVLPAAIAHRDVADGEIRIARGDDLADRSAHHGGGVFTTA
jgi:hypothetical protein